LVDAQGLNVLVFSVIGLIILILNKLTTKIGPLDKGLIYDVLCRFCFTVGTSSRGVRKENAFVSN